MSSKAARARGTTAIPEPEGAVAATPIAELDRVIARLGDHKDEWVKVGVPERLKLLDRLIKDTLAVADEQVAAAWKAKGIRPGTPLAGEEWLVGPLVVLRNLRLLAESLKDIERFGAPRIPGEVKARADGRVVAEVFPASRYDKVFFAGFTVDMWMRDDVTLANLASTQAKIYRDKDHDGRVALVLGAGNVASIGPTDALYKLFVEDEVVILKMNPVNSYVGPYLERSFRALSERGFFQVVYGGVAEGVHLCGHEGVGSIHVTGSDKTHDAIVFGVGPEAAKRKVERKPLLDKPITSELGNVSPVIVVPGPWSDGDLTFQGENIASMLTNNAAFNCNAARVIVQHDQWGLRPALLSRIRSVLAAVEPRVAYYPGAQGRYDDFIEAHPEAETFGDRTDDVLPWTLIADLDPGSEEDICFSTEAFCSVFSETALAAETVAGFIDDAVAFCNERVWGTLNASIIVHPESLKDPEIAAAVDRALNDLRYGTVGVNTWPALGFGMVTPTWGAHPGHDIYDIQSGIGSVHNTYMFGKPLKSVISGPFRIKPKPPWFVTHRATHELGPKMARFEAAPSMLKIPGIVKSALKG
jgi:hypothetical protein